MIKPSFFIVGAPKCGTTALCHYLAEHPAVYFSRIKEPFFFCDDFSDRYRVCRTEEEYLHRCFPERGTSNGDAIIAGEASTIYMYSERALSNIRAFCPRARIIVMLRNPVEMIYAYYATLRYVHEENAKTFEEAWSLQEPRLGGAQIPKTCREPALLQYRRVGQLGRQLEKVYSFFPPDQVHVVLLDDMKASAGDTYRGTLRFLGLEDDQRTYFPSVNDSRTFRLGWLSLLARRPPRWLINIRDKAGVHGFGIQRRLVSWNTHRQARAAMPHSFRRMISGVFAPEVDLLEELTGRNLEHWRE